MNFDKRVRLIIIWNLVTTRQFHQKLLYLQINAGNLRHHLASKINIVDPTLAYVDVFYTTVSFI